MGKIKSRIILPTGTFLTTELDSSFYILPNFNVGELANNLAKDDIKFEIPLQLSWTFLTMMQIVRDKKGSMTVNSGYRTESFNASLKYADPKSAHLHMCALDEGKKGQSLSDRKDITTYFKNLCREFGVIGAINWYTNGQHYEIGSDLWYGNTEFVIRDFRGKPGDW